MSLRDLCNEFWDEIVYLMDYQVLERIMQPVGGLSRIEAVRAYCRLDPGLLEKLSSYLHLERSEVHRERQILLKAS